MQYSLNPKEMNYDFVNTQLVIKDGKVSVTDNQQPNELDESSHDEDTHDKENTHSGDESDANTNSSSHATHKSSVQQPKRVDSSFEELDLDKRLNTFTIEEFSKTEQTLYKASCIC